MGGDLAPGMVIKGANIARQRFPQARFLIFGNEGRIEPLLKKVPHLAKVSSIRHTDIVVKSEDKPSAAARRARGSSMHLACEAVQSGEAAGVVSAGNTGALMAIAMLMLRTLPGIHRPAIAGFFPTLRSESVMLDLGANVECDADNLVQFAIMGNVFARTVLGVLQPTVGILNVGSEELKGHEAVREASAMLRNTPMPGSFHGFVEGDDIAKGTVDVVVTDGFTGNVALKTIEGTAKLYTGFLRESFRTSIMAKRRLPAGASGDQQPAHARRSAPLQRRHLPRPQRHRREEPRRHRRHRLRQRDRRRRRHGRARRHREDQRGLRPPDDAAAAGREGGQPLMATRSIVAGCGAYLPSRILSNADLARKLETSDEWIVQRTGIRERRIAADGEMTSDLAIRAAEAALKNAGMSGNDIDLIVVATSTPDETFPGHGHARAGRARHDPRRRLRRAGGMLGLRVRARRGRQFHEGGAGAHRAGHRRRDLLAHPRLERPHDLRAVRRRRRRGRAGRRRGQRRARTTAACSRPTSSPTAAITTRSTSTAARPRR